MRESGISCRLLLEPHHEPKCGVAASAPPHLMSRNKEKAQGGLNRYYEEKARASGLVVDQSSRPRRVQSVKTLAEAELWRKTIVSEISAKLSAIYDPSLSDDELRSLNDQLNTLHKEKRAWDHHIVSLGGTDHARHEKRLGHRVDGTMFYGRAKNLPEAATNQKESEATPVDRKPDSHPTILYYGSPGPLIDASLDTVIAEINGALGKEVLPGKIGGPPPDTYTQSEVEMHLVEQKKKQLMAQLLAS